MLVRLFKSAKFVTLPRSAMANATNRAPVYNHAEKKTTCTDDCLLEHPPGLNAAMEVNQNPECNGPVLVAEKLPMSDRRYTVSLQIDLPVLTSIIGKGGCRLAQLEQETGTRISTPVCEPSRLDDNVIITAESEEVAEAAVEKIKSLYKDALTSKSLRVNYFVCLPVTSPHVQKAFLELKSKIAALPNAEQSGLDGSLFISDKKLHLTVLVMKLYSNGCRARACQVLKDLEEKLKQASDHKGLRFELKSLKTMRNRVINAHVLYMDLQECSEVVLSQIKEEPVSSSSHSKPQMQPELDESYPKDASQGLASYMGIEDLTAHLDSTENQTTPADIGGENSSSEQIAAKIEIEAEEEIGKEVVRAATKAGHSKQNTSGIRDAGGVVQLQAICRRIVKAFEDADLIQDAGRDPLLHLTIMNTKYRRLPKTKLESETAEELSDGGEIEGPASPDGLSSEQRPFSASSSKIGEIDSKVVAEVSKQVSRAKKKRRRKHAKRVPFDATKVLKQFGESSLGPITVDRIELSQMTAVDENGFYHCLERVYLSS